MSQSRTKNAFRNVAFGFVMKIMQILLPFATRTIIIRILGMKYLGLSSLFTSVLSVLNLAELGVGSAMVFSMYEPIAKDDKETVCALLKLYRLYYRIIGIVVGTVGIVLIPLLPRLIKDDVPSDINLVILYLMNLGATVASYWLLAYKGSILSAHQREDVASKVRIIMTMLQNLLQIVAIILTKNYYSFVMIALLIQIFTNICIAILATRMYPQYTPKGNLDSEMTKDINHRIRDLFTSRVGSVVFSSVDTIVISSFLGLEMVGIYQNYYYIVNSLIGILQVVYSACMAGIGNSIITETKEKNFKDLKKLTFIISWVAGWCTCCLVAMYQPFMMIWVGEKGMLSFQFVVCLSVFFYIWEIYRLLNVYKDAAGMWHDDRFRPLACAITNLTINIILIQIWGLYGIILSTVLSVVFIGSPWLIINIFNNVFDLHYCRSYLKRIVFYVVITALACILNYVVCTFVHGSYAKLFVIRGIISCFIPNIVFLCFYFKTAEYSDAIKLCKRIIHR